MYDEETPVKNYLDTRLLLSTDPNFGSSSKVAMVYNSTYDVWIATVSTAQFSVGQQIFMRFEARDTDHAEVTQLPNERSPDYMKKHFSFVVQ